MWQNNMFLVVIVIVTFQVIYTLPNYRSSTTRDQVFNNKSDFGNRSSYRFPYHRSYRFPYRFLDNTPRSGATSQPRHSDVEEYNSNSNSSGPTKFSLTAPSRGQLQQNTRDEVLLAQYPQHTSTLPPYVIAVQKSVTRYRRLLTGLSLYNLGRSGQVGDVLNKTIKYVKTPSIPISRKDTNCTFNLVTQNTTNILLIPCEIVTSFYVRDSYTRTSSASVTKSPAAYFTATALKSSAKSNKVKPKTNIQNPLDKKYKGAAIDITGMLCSVVIKGKNSTRSAITPCRVLNQYAASLNRPSSTYIPRFSFQKSRRT